MGDWLLTFLPHAPRERADALALTGDLLARILAVRRGVLDFRVHLGADKDGEAGHVEPEKQHHAAAELLHNAASTPKVSKPPFSDSEMRRI